MRCLLLLSLSLFVFAAHRSVRAKEIRLGITPSCNYEVHHFDEETSYLLEWQGEDPGDWGCKLGFQGNNDSFEICVDTIDFHLQIYGISVNYYAGTENQELEKTFKKFDSPDIFCKKDDLIAVEVITERRYSWNKINTSSSYFTLNITGTTLATDDSDSFSDGFMPLIILGVILGIVVCGAICRQYRYQNTCRPGQRSVNQRRVATVARAGNTDPPQASYHSLEITSAHVPTQDSNSTHHAQAPETSSGFNFPIHVNHYDLENSNHPNAEAYNSRTLPTAPPPPSAPLSTGARVPEMAPPSYSEVMNMK